ncbi:Uncharacterized protein dnm_032250 [Desulfonema magnum]|uniref:Uncharacterized protein n=1 Tax=Desulfonema magnum TaxID=45655 RepID=A0A975GMY2_9BACT|nr:Uncharacterized protein dnm_032250 [Desulfonema magnum]
MTLFAKIPPLPQFRTPFLRSSELPKETGDDALCKNSAFASFLHSFPQYPGFLSFLTKI